LLARRLEEVRDERLDRLLTEWRRGQVETAAAAERMLRLLSSAPDSPSHD
jgi:hypothetical protein